ncbi:choice-of-anchor D domain-containing protein, partial [bacterium]|nr:choice-of-anchor D domain-containing protein [bacterium]
MYYLREKRDTKSIAIIGITALLFLSVQHASAQESWPSSWNQMLTASWASMTDPTSDHNPSDVDIINDGAPVCSYFDASSSMLFFRMALGDDPINGGKLKPYAWQVEIDVDGDGVQDWNVRAGGITEKLYVYYYPGGAETATFTLNLPVASGYVRSVPNGSVYYLDIQAPFSAFQKSGYTKNIYSDTPFRMFYHTSTAEAVTIKDATVNSTDISGAFALSATQTIDGDGAYGYVYDTRDLDPYSTNGTWNSNETITVSGTGWPPSSAAAGVYNNGERGIRITNSGGTPLWTGTVTTSADGVLSSAPTWKVPASAPSGAYAIHMEDPRSSGTWHFYDSLTVNQLTISEMDLVQGTIDITDGGSYDYGSKASGTDTDVVFTIKNTGTAPLTLTTPLSITGTNADQFSIESQPTGPVAAGGSTTFTVRFTPTSTGSKTATISITNGDSDENPYDLTLNGTGTAPEMDLVQGTTDVADGGSYDFGGRATGSDTDVVFTIRNTGNAPLTLTTPLTISGADADQFSIQSQPTGPVAAGGSTTFTVRFTPTSTGGKTASISIANNDGNENPYNLTLNGTGTAPEFDLVQGTTDVADGGSYNFGTKATGTTTDIVFTIKNTGTGNLNFVTPISLAGAGADQFSIQSQPTGPVAAGGSTTFTVRFAPTSA